MNSFTKRPVTDWSVSNTTYRIGTSVTGISLNKSVHGETDVPYSEDPGVATTFGLTALYNEAGTTRNQTFAELGRTTSEDRRESDRSLSIVHQSSHDPNTAINFSDTHTESSNGSFKTSRTAADTWRSSVSLTSVNSGSSSTDVDTAGSSTTATSTTSSSIVTGATTQTGSGTTTTYTTETVPIDLSTFTTATTDGVFVPFTTSSSSTTFSTTVTSTTGSVSSSSSTWGTLYATLTDQATTTTDATTDQTWTEDATTANTATTNPRTTWAFETMLRDTVYMLNADVGSNEYNLGGMLWWYKTGLAATASTAGLFSDLFSSSAAETVTVSEYSAFLTSSAAVTAITTSSGTRTTSGTHTTTTDTAHPPETTTTVIGVTSSNGVSYESTGSTVTWSASWSLGDVGTSQSTWEEATTEDTDAPLGSFSSTIFTHSTEATGYSDGTSFSTATTTETWGVPSSTTGTRHVAYSSAATTITLSSRGTTTDAALFSSFTTWTDGTETSTSFLGMVSTATTRVSSASATFTCPTWAAALHTEVPSYTTTYTVIGDASFSETTSGGASLTAFTEARGELRVIDRPGHDNIPPLNEAWFEVIPFGLCGFGGSFTVSNLSAYLTTSQGLAAGSTFTDETLAFTRTELACEGITFYPVTTGFEILGGSRAVSTSIVSVPSIMTSEISVAVTWTSSTSTTFSNSTTSGTTSTVSSREATHTIAMTSVITGTFISADAVTINSTARTEFDGEISGGYAMGDNNRGENWTVFLRQGCARWTEYSSGQSTSPDTHSSTGTDASISFTVPHSKAAVITMEPVLSARWDSVGMNSAFSSQQHQKHS